MKIRLKEIISDTFIKKLRTLEYVDINIINKIYYDLLKEYEVDTSNIDNECGKLLENKIEKLEAIEDSTLENLNKLEKNTEVAMVAIKDKNYKELKTINDSNELLKKEIQILKEKIYIDELTGIYNRKWVSDYIIKDDVFLYDGFIIMIDLNKFKYINDTYGHVVGDKVIRNLSHTLIKMKKTFNINVVRYGGDEFICFIKSNEDIYQKVENYMKNLSKLYSNTRLIYKNKYIESSFSYGVFPYKKDFIYSDTLIEADKKMYENKQFKKKRKEKVFDD